ncbi:hypothetical protein BH09BAC3_BH09BAC3_36430 [soil metagenome]
MVIKIFKAVWFFSLLGTILLFMYIYASLPEDIYFTEEGTFSVTRNGIFYSTLAVLGIINALVFVITRIFITTNGYFQAWFYGLVAFFNIFLVVSLQFISTYNSQERYTYDNVGYIIYGSIALIILWSSLWPVYRLMQRFTSKQAV